MHTIAWTNIRIDCGRPANRNRLKIPSTHGNCGNSLIEKIDFDRGICGREGSVYIIIHIQYFFVVVVVFLLHPTRTYACLSNQHNDPNRYVLNNSVLWTMYAAVYMYGCNRNPYSKKGTPIYTSIVQRAGYGPR